MVFASSKTSGSPETSESRSPGHHGVQVFKGLLARMKKPKSEKTYASVEQSIGGSGMLPKTASLASNSIAPFTPPVSHPSVPTNTNYSEPRPSIAHDPPSAVDNASHQSQPPGIPTMRMLTVLLVGEIGAGKTTLLNLIANTLEGRGPMTYQAMHDASNEATGSTVGSRTCEAHIYEFKSRDGVKIRLIDTPGLADTRGTEHDEKHMASIVRVIREAIVVDGVLIVADGTTERLQVATDYTMMTLASILPRSIANNIAILFTKVSDPMSFNLQVDSLPSSLQESCIFFLNNPIALTKQCQARNNPFLQVQAVTPGAIGDAHPNAVGMLAQVFDWLNQCTYQETSAIGNLYKKGCAIDCRIHNALVLINAVSEKQRDVARIKEEISNAKLMMTAYRNYESVMAKSIKVKTQTPHYNTLCLTPNCHSNCHPMCSEIPDSFSSESFRSCNVMRDGSCTQCHHPVTDHCHSDWIWEERSDTEAVVNQGAKEKYYSAWRDRTNSESALDEVETAIRDVNTQIEALKPEIGMLCTAYQALSLSGCVSGQISKSIQLFKLNLDTLQFAGADPQRIQTIENAIEKMRQKRRLVDEAMAVARIAPRDPSDSIRGATARPLQDGDNELQPHDGFEALKKGFLLTKKQNMTILVVGETGVGKTALLNLITNVLEGQDPAHYRDMHNPANEAGGLKTGSQTQEALTYEFWSLNGIRIRFVDTPGLADTRGIEHDKKHKESIARTIKDTVPMIDGILIVANGTTERLQVATDYAVTTLASFFPRSIADNIAIVFTMVANPMSFNFQMNSLPKALHKSQIYCLENPISLMKRYRDLEHQPLFRTQLPEMRKIVDDAHTNAVKMLFEFFRWIDQRTVQPTSAIVELYNSVCDIDRRVQNALARMNLLSEKRTEVLRIRLEMSRMKQVMKQYEQFETVMNLPMKVQTETTDHNTVCGEPACYSNCHIKCLLPFSIDPEDLKNCLTMRTRDGVVTCVKCRHPAINHHHYHSVWEDKTDRQVTVDEVAKNKFHSAKLDNEKQEAALNQVEAAITDLDSEIKDLKTEIRTLCASYQTLALSGSFSGQISKAVRLFQLNLRTLQENGADPATIETVQKIIKELEQKLEVVEEAAAAANLNIQVIQSPASPGARLGLSGLVNRGMRLISSSA